MRTIDAARFGVLEIGYAGEKNRTEVLFDYSDLAEEFPGGTILLQVRRPGETTKYDSASVTVDGTRAVWTVSDYDCGIKGFGECQLIYSTAENIAKRKTWKTHIERSIEGGNASIPPDWEDIETSLLNAAGAVSEELAEARTYIDGAVEAAETAQQGAERAQEAAEAVMEEYEAMTASATTLPPESEATSTIDRTGTTPVLRLGIPKGDKGDPGDSVEVDAVPTRNSNNPVASGGVYSAVAAKADAVNGVYFLNVKSTTNGHWVVEHPVDFPEYYNGMMLMLHLYNVSSSGGQVNIELENRTFEYGGAFYIYGPPLYKDRDTPFTDACPAGATMLVTLYGPKWYVCK